MAETQKKDEFCCEFFRNNFHSYGWHKLQHEGEVTFIMPYILGSNIRVNFCPTCGKKSRDTTISESFYNNN